MTASLAMYDWPELRGAAEAFYQRWRQALLARGMSPPKDLRWDLGGEETWTDPELFMAQTCGYPFAMGDCGAALLVATPVYGAPGCEGARYCSVVVMAESDNRELADIEALQIAVNGPRSHSGFNAFRLFIQDNGLTDAVRSIAVSGSHLESMAMVARGDADVAAIDAIVWEHCRRHRPDLRTRLREVGRSRLAPGLPLITSAQRSSEELRAMREALAEVIDDPALAPSRETLLIEGIELLSASDYQPIAEFDRQGASLRWDERLRRR